jgi:type IV pilus assembly protein PilO
MFEKLPLGAQLGIIALLCVAALLGSYYYFFPGTPAGISSFKEQNVAKQDELDKINREIFAGQEAARRRAELEKEIAQKDLELASLRRILPTGPEAGQLIKWLEGQASRFNLVIKSLSEATIKQQEFYKEYTYAMQIVGNYHDLGRFYDVIGKHDRIVNIRNVNLKKNTGSDARTRSISGRFSALTFVYSEPQGG